MSKVKDFSYFNGYLKRYLRDIGSPEASDERLIKERADLAESTFERCCKEGYTTYGAMEVAIKRLTDGVGTNYCILLDCIENEFPGAIRESKRKTVARKLYPTLKDVFDRYAHLNEQIGDKGPLYNELTGAVAEYVAIHGIQ